MLQRTILSLTPLTFQQKLKSGRPCYTLCPRVDGLKKSMSINLCIQDTHEAVSLLQKDNMELNNISPSRRTAIAHVCMQSQVATGHKDGKHAGPSDIHMLTTPRNNTYEYFSLHMGVLTASQAFTGHFITYTVLVPLQTGSDTFSVTHASLFRSQTSITGHVTGILEEHVQHLPSA